MEPNTIGQPVQFPIHTIISSQFKLDDKEKEHLIRQVSQEAMSRLKEADQSLENVNVDITYIDLSKSIVHYSIKNSAGFNKECDLFKEVRDTTGDLLARFDNEDSGKGLNDNSAKESIRAFFKFIAKPFQKMGEIWSNITGKTAEKMKWDFSLLQDICGTYHSDGKIDRTRALKYFSQILKKENKEDSKSLQERIDRAYHYSEGIQSANRSLSYSAVKVRGKRVVEQIKKDLQKQDVLLIPIGYENNQMLAEIRKKDDGKYQISLLTMSTEQRELFARSEDSEKIHRLSPERIIDNVDLSDIESRIGAWVEMQLDPIYRIEFPTFVFKREFFLETFVIENSRLVDIETTKKVKLDTTIGKTNDVMDYIKRLRGKDADHFDMSVRLHLFRSITNESDKWLADSNYRQHVVTTGQKILNEIHANGDALFKDLSDRTIQMTDIINEIEGILQKIDKFGTVLDINKQKSSGERKVFHKNIRKDALYFEMNEGVVNANKTYFTEKDLQLASEKELMKSTSVFLTRCNQLFKDKQYDLLYENINLFCSTFPPIDSDILKTLSKEDRENLSIDLNAIGNHWMSAKVALKPDDKSVKDEDILTSLTLLSWSHKLMVLESGAQLVGVNWAYQPMLTLLSWGPFELSPSERMRIEGIKNYVDTWIFAPPTEFMKDLKERYKEGLSVEGKNAITQLEWIGSALEGVEPSLLFDTSKNYTGKIEYDPVQNIVYYASKKNRILLKGQFSPKLVPKRKHWIYHDDISSRKYVATKNEQMQPDSKIVGVSPVYATSNAHELGKSLIAKKSFTQDEVSELLRTQEIVHELSSAVTDDLDKKNKNIQGKNTLVAFLRNTQFFKRDETRALFIEKMFSNECFKIMLSSEFAEENKIFIRSLFDSLAVQMSIANRDNDIDSLAFIIRIRERMKEEINLATIDTKIKDFLFENAQESSIDLLLKYIDGYRVKEPDSDNRKLLQLYGELLSEYLSKVKHDGSIVNYSSYDNLVDVTHAIDKIFQLQGPNYQNEETILKNIHLAKQLFTPVIEGFLDADTTTNFVNAVALKNDKNFKTTEWQLNKDSGFPVFKAKNPKDLLFNLLTGQFFYGKVQAQPLPAHVIAKKEIQDLFPDVLHQPWKVYSDSSRNLIIYVNPNYPNFRLIPNGADVIVQRKIEGDEKNYMQLIYPGTAQMYLEKKFSKILENEDYVFSTENKLYVYSSSKKKLTYEYSDAGLQDKEGFIALAPKTRKTEFNALSPNNNCIFWGRKGRVEKVTYPFMKYSVNQSPVTYTLAKDGFQCNLFPGYKLSTPNEYAGAIGLPAEFKNYQLLENDGKFKLMIAGGDLGVVVGSETTQRSKKEAERGEAYLERGMISASDELLVYSYDVDKESGKLIANSSEAYLYLSNLMGTYKNFSAALYYLEKAGITNVNYENAIKLLSTFNDRSFAGTAFSLKRELLMEKLTKAHDTELYAKGEIIGFEDNDSRLKRLSEIVLLTDRYQELEEAYKQTDSKQIDPLLALSGDDKDKLNLLLQEFVDNQELKINVPSPELTPAIKNPTTRGPEIALGLEQYAMQERVLELWANAGNEPLKGPLILREKEWIKKSFLWMVQFLHDTSPSDAKFKELALAVRLRTNETEFDRHSYEGILMRLITAKEKGVPIDLGLIDGKFPQMRGRILHIPQLRQGTFMKCHSPYKFPLIIAEVNTHISDLRRRRWPNDNWDLGLFEANRAIRPLKRYRFFLYRNRNKNLDPVQKKEAFLDTFLGKSGRVAIKKWESVLNKIDQLPGDLEVNDWQVRVGLSAIPFAENEQIDVTQKARDLLEKLNSKDKGSAQIATKQVEYLEKSIENTKAVSMEPVKMDAEKTIIDGISFKEVDSHETCETDFFNQFKDVKNGALARIAKEHHQDFDRYANSVKTQKTISLSKDEALALENTVSERYEKMVLLKDELSRNIVQEVERTIDSAGMIAMDRIAGQKSKPKIDYLISLWRMGTLTNAWEANPLKDLGIQQMSPEVLKTLDNNITRYLQLQADCGHLERTIDALIAFKESVTKKIPQGDSQKASVIHRLLTTQRFYKIDNIAETESTLGVSQRDLLFLEAQLDLILRKDQIETLTEMLTDPNAARQLPMGGGKSKLLLPLLAKRKADGKNLVALVVPDFLYETNRSNLLATNRELFNQDLFCFEFSRRSTVDEDALKNMRVRLLETIKDKGFIITTKSFMLNFMNSFKEKEAILAKISKMDMTTEKGQFIEENLSLNVEDYRDKLVAELREMSEILGIFKNNGDVVGDEIDGLLDVRKMVNFAIGNRKGIDPIKTGAASSVMNLIMSSDVASPLHALAVDIGTNFQGAMTPKKRDEYISLITQTYFDSIKVRFGLKEEDKEIFTQYMTNSELVKEIPEFIKRIRHNNQNEFREIISAKEFINVGLRTTLQRVGNVEYGRDPITKRLVIPYKASNTPSIGSEFNDEMERIAYTFQDYIQTGVTYEALFEKVAFYRREAINQFRVSDPDEILTIDDTESGIAFKNLIEKLDPENRISRSLALRDEQSEIKKLLEFINSSPKAKLTYCIHEVLPAIEQTMDQVTGNAEDLVQMFKNFGGFTGTPWNLHAYSDKIDAKKREGVDGRTYFTLLKKPISVVTIDLDKTDPVGALLNQTNLVNCQALIDAGAYLRGIPNHEFTERVQSKAKNDAVPIASVVYFNNAGNIVSVDTQTKDVTPIEEVQSQDLEHQFTLYDQSHTVGADILQSPKAKAIVTIGEDTFIKDLFQAVWRFRQLDKDQSVTFVITQKIKERILGDDYGTREPTTEDILKYCMMNESVRESEDNYRAEKEKIDGAPLRSMVEQMITLGKDPKAGVEDFCKMAEAFSKTLIKSRDEEKSYERFAEVQTLKEPSLVIAESRKQSEAKLKSVAKRLPKNLNTYSTALFKAGDELASRSEPDKNLMPEVVKVVGDSLTTEVQTQAQNEQESLVQLELLEEKKQTEQQQQITAAPIPNVKPNDHDYKIIQKEELDDLLSQGIGAKSVGDQFLSIGHAISMFDENFFTTTSFEPNMTKDVKVNVVIYPDRQPVMEVMFCKNNEGKMTAILLSKQQVRDACQKYIQTSGVNGAIVTLGTRVPLVHVTSVENSTEIPFEDEDLKAYHKLLVQAKLFAGVMTFPSEEERQALKDWIQKFNIDEFVDFYEKTVLVNLPLEKQKGYIESSLYRIFQSSKQKVME